MVEGRVAMLVSLRAVRNRIDREHAQPLDRWPRLAGTGTGILILLTTPH